MLSLEDQRAKLFIKVDGVIGDRKRICTFCNSTIEGIEKVIETTRKLRHGPYFPQLAYLQSAVGKIDTLGRAVVCLQCFHQLLRQWNTYEQRKIPVSRRMYKYVPDKGVKNYQETRAFEIRIEAEKRAFAIHTKQDHIVKEAFEKLTNLLDIEEELIKKSEECVLELNRKLSQCTKSERWKITREIEKHKKIISAAEFRIEEAEDREEEIRKETKAILCVYRNNNSLFQAVSEPNLRVNGAQIQQTSDSLSEDLIESSPSNLENKVLDTVDGVPMHTDGTREPFVDYDYYQKPDSSSHRTVIKTVKRGVLSAGEIDDNNFRSSKHYGKVSSSKHDENDDVWDDVENSRGYLRNKHGPSEPVQDWHLVKEIIHPVESRSQSFPEDVWSEMFLKEPQSRTESKLRSANMAQTNMNRGQQNDLSSKDNRLTGKGSDLVSLREDHTWKETYTDDSEEEAEKIYEVNPQIWSTDKSTYLGRLERDPIPGSTGADLEEIQKNQLLQNVNDGAVGTTQTRSISNDVSADPWDNIHIKKEKEKILIYDSRAQSLSRPQAKEDVFYVDEYDEEFASRNEQEVLLSPRRLSSDRFTEFTKSSYVPQPVKKQHSIAEENYKSAPKQSIDVPIYNRETKVTILEKRKNDTVEQNGNVIQNRNRPVESVERNKHERHLSVEEEEWETKHLSPKRLNESKWFSFLNETSTDKTHKESTTLEIHQSKSGYAQDTYKRPNKCFDTRNASDIDIQAEMRVERSPAMRKLMRQDEMTYSEKPIQKSVTNGFLQSDPWNDLNGKTINQNSSQKNDENFKDISDNDMKVGRLDLKRWSSEVEKNRIFDSNEIERKSTYIVKELRSDHYSKQNSLTADQVAPKNEVVILNRNQSPKRCGDVFLLKSNDVRTTRERSVSPSPKYSRKIDVSDDSGEFSPVSTRTNKNQETVIIKEQDSRPYTDLESSNDRRIGKINLGLWEQNSLSHFDPKASATKSKVSPAAETRSPPFSPTRLNSAVDARNDRNSSKFEDDGIFRRNIATQQSRSANPRPDNPSGRPQVFNQSLSEDELVWEKRFSKSYEKTSSEIHQDPETQRKISDPRKPRLINDDEDENYLEVGKIVLDVEEMRRIRDDERKRKKETAPTSAAADPINTYQQSWSEVSIPESTERTKYGEMSQLSEEEQAWDEKTSRPGKLDFSKFSHFA